MDETEERSDMFRGLANSWIKRTVILVSGSPTLTRWCRWILLLLRPAHFLHNMPQHVWLECFDSVSRCSSDFLILFVSFRADAGPGKSWSYGAKFCALPRFESPMLASKKLVTLFAFSSGFDSVWWLCHFLKFWVLNWCHSCLVIMFLCSFSFLVFNFSLGWVVKF